MNIGQAAQYSGLSAKAIRYYEQTGLLTPQRLANGYRDYSKYDLSCLLLIRRARHLGFDMEECRQLLDLYQNPQRSRGEVKQLVRHQLELLDDRLSALQALRRDLAALEQSCSGGSDPHCAILDALSVQSSVKL